jgi:hypothetical protein
MSKRVVVVIVGDPLKSHRPVEALRIALGLCAGDHETTVVLLEQAPLLVTDRIDDVIDVDVLEKYRPSFAQLAIPFVIPVAPPLEGVRPEFSVSLETNEEIYTLIHAADRTLVFS